MDWVQALGWQGLQAIVQLFLHPFLLCGHPLYYFAIPQTNRDGTQAVLYEAARSPAGDVANRVMGMGRGLCVSVLMAGIGVTVQQEAVLLLWIVSLLLVIVRVRYLCWAYAVGVIGMLQVVLSAIPGVRQSDDWAWLTKPLFALDIPAMLALVAILHLAEAIYVRKQGTRLACRCLSRGSAEESSAVTSCRAFGRWRCFSSSRCSKRRAGLCFRGRRCLGASCGRTAGRLWGFPS